jgi:acetylornithine/succinyldiaminopimelate/putrescine aminotransferase
MRGVRCADPKRAGAVTAKAFEYGLIIERAGPEDEVIKCMMPLTTPYDELDEGLDILERALHDEFSKVVATPKPTISRPAAISTSAIDRSLGAP